MMVMGPWVGSFQVLQYLEIRRTAAHEDMVSSRFVNVA